MSISLVVFGPRSLIGSPSLDCLKPPDFELAAVKEETRKEALGNQAKKHLAFQREDFLVEGNGAGAELPEILSRRKLIRDEVEKTNAAFEQEKATKQKDRSKKIKLIDEDGSARKLPSEFNSQGTEDGTPVSFDASLSKHQADTVSESQLFEGEWSMEVRCLVDAIVIPLRCI